MTPFETACSHLMQECGELTRVASKLQMFGPTPVHNGVRYDNVADLHRGFADVVTRMYEVIAFFTAHKDPAIAVLMPGDKSPHLSTKDTKWGCCYHCLNHQLFRFGDICRNCGKPLSKL